MAEVEIDSPHVRQGRRSNASSESSSVVGDKKPYIILVFLIVLVLPNYFFLGPLRLSVYKLFLLVMFIPLFFQWISGKFNGVRKPDILLFCFCCWSYIAIFFNHGFERWEAGGINFVETFGAYLLARAFIRGPVSFEAFIGWFCWIVVFLVPIAVIENFTTRRLIVELMSNFAFVYPDAMAPYRWGMKRAQGPFEHPILFGVFCSIALAPAIFIWTRKRGGFSTGIAGFLMFYGTFTSLSMGALISLWIQAILMGWELVTRIAKTPNRWRLLTIIFAILYVIVDMLSNRTPIQVFISYAAFDAGSSYNRINIWRYGTAEVYRHPIFGIGFNDWVRAHWMSASMDNYWLLQTVRYGIPGLIMMSWAFFSVAFGAGFRNFDGDERMIALRKGYLMGLVGLFLSLCTVTLWSGTYVFLIFLVGAGVWMMDYEPQKTAPVIDPKDRKAARMANKAAGQAKTPTTSANQTESEFSRGGSVRKPLSTERKGRSGRHLPN